MPPKGAKSVSWTQEVPSRLGPVLPVAEAPAPTFGRLQRRPPTPRAGPRPSEAPAVPVAA